MRRRLPLLFLLCAVPAFAAEPATPAAADAAVLRAEILARDQAFFELNFDRCAPEELRALLADDLEFFHDKGGAILGASAFVDDYAKSCAKWGEPDAWRSRRRLVEATVHVDPIPGYGAIEAGEHRFYERQGNGPEKLVGRALFVIVWQHDGANGWRMKRAVSYDHSPASE